MVSGAGPGTPRPPGISAWPIPGTSTVSPAFAELLRHDTKLANSIGPVTTNLIGSSGLISPDELMSYTVSKTPAQAQAHEPGQSSANGSQVIGFGRAGSDSSSSSPLLLILEIVLLVLTPAALFLATVLRLSAVSRTRRSVALSLAGMSPTHAARLYSREMAVVAVAGYAIGASAFAALQGRLGASGVLGIRWWPHQGQVGALTVALTGIVALAVVMKVARKSMTAAIVQSRATRDSTSSKWPVWVAFLVGLPACGFIVAVTVMGLLRPSNVWASDRLTLLILGAIVASVVAVILGSVQLIRAIAEPLASRCPATLSLGLRGASHRLPSSRRLIAFVACAVMLAGISTAFVESLRRAAVGDPEEATISFSVADVSQHRGWISQLPRGPFAVEATLPGTGGTYDVVVGDCPAVTSLDTVVFPNPGPCIDSVQRAAFGLVDGETAQAISIGTHSVKVPATAPRAEHVSWNLKFPLADAPWLSDVTDGSVTYYVARNDPQYQSILIGLATQFPELQVQAGLKNPDQYAEYRKQVGTVKAAVMLGILLSICSFLVTALENRWARSRSVAMLAAIGAGRNDLRAANLVEFAFPVLVAIVPAAAVGILGGWAVVSINGSDNMFSPRVAETVTVGSAVCLVLALAVGWVTGGATFQREAVADT
jgi:hypothetical protein